MKRDCPFKVGVLYLDIFKLDKTMFIGKSNLKPNIYV